MGKPESDSMDALSHFSRAPIESAEKRCTFDERPPRESRRQPHSVVILRQLVPLGPIDNENMTASADKDEILEPLGHFIKVRTDDLSAASVETPDIGTLGDCAVFRRLPAEIMIEFFAHGFDEPCHFDFRIVFHKESLVFGFLLTTLLRKNIEVKKS
jgi:hypothetical protein